MRTGAPGSGCLELMGPEVPASAVVSARELLADAARRAASFLDALPGRAVPPSAAALAALERLDVPLPQGPTEAAAVLARLDEIVSPATMATAGPRFFGFVIGGALPVTVAANFLATAWDQNAALSQAAPGVAHLEQLVLRWLRELFALPADTAGAFVTGGTMANLTALAAARHRVLARAGWDVEADGLFGAPAVNVVVGAEAHPTLFKALGVLGLGRERVIRVRVDRQGRLDAAALPALVGPTIVCAQAGNVNSGAFDPLPAICDWAQGCGAWVHVDGAFGMWARVAPAFAPLAAGLERADSWSTDAHKWLNVPYDSGIALVRDAQALRAAMSVAAAYLPADAGGRNPSDCTPELSRCARAVDIWAALASLGRSGTADLIERCCRHAQRFAAGLRDAGLEILNEVVLNQVLVSFGSPERTRRVIEAVQADGTCWCGITEWQGRTAMRISVCSWATTEADIERSIGAMLGAYRGTGPA
jgi:glutamate/tyrosine decarboxylase-like PLP-dependent enzyme